MSPAAVLAWIAFFYGRLAVGAIVLIGGHP